MKKALRMLAVGLALTAIAACGGSSGGGGGGGSTDTDVCGGATQGCLTGVIQDSTGSAIGNVTVTSETAAAAAQTVAKAATELTTSNSQGWFTATGLEEGDQVICFSATGYVRKCLKVNITAQENTPLPPMMLATRGTAVTVTAVENGGTAADPSGTAGQINFPAGSVCDSSGAAVTGDIECYLTPVDPTDDASLGTLAESFVAISAAGTQGTMVSDAMMDITCEQNGAEVNICTGQTATVRLPIYNASCATTEADAGWYFDESTGVWQQYDTGAFNRTCGTDETNSYFEFDVDHLTLVNGDKQVDDACLTGLVYLSEGQATGSNVTVQCWGSGWKNTVTVNSDGRFCVPVPVSRSYTCRVGDSSGWIDSGDYISGTAPATVVDFPVTTCPADGCEETTGFIFASPILTTTLTWGLNPADLDSHTIGSNVHVYFVDKDTDFTKGSLTSSPFIALDTDDTTSYGPEVTTVMPSVADGIYCFYVYKYSGTGLISQESTDQNGDPKRGTVTVIGEGVARTFTVPSDNPGSYDYWRLYSVEFEGGTVKSGTFNIHNDLVETEPINCDW